MFSPSVRVGIGAACRVAELLAADLMESLLKPEFVAVPAIRHQACLAELGQVAGNIGLRRAHHLRKLANAQFAVRDQQRNTPEPGLVRQGGEHRFRSYIHIFMLRDISGLIYIDYEDLVTTGLIHYTGSIRPVGRGLNHEIAFCS